jgi:hypothetical protein
MASSTTEKPVTVGIAEIAAKLGVEPHKLRAFIRTLDLGVGRGTRYTWPSMAHPAVKRIVREWGDKHHTEA